MSLIWKTDRLILRRFQDVDIQPFVGYRSNSEIAKYQHWEIPFTQARAAKFIEEMKSIQPGTPGECYQIAIELKTMHQIIGDCEFCILAEDSQQASISRQRLCH